MIFAVWWRSGRPPPEDLALRVKELVDRPEAARASAGGSTLAAWAPARLEHVRTGVGAFAMPGVSEDRLVGHPSVRLEGDVLTLSAGALPQYPLYYTRSPRDEYLLACTHLEPLVRLMPAAPLNVQRLVGLMAWPLDLDTEATVYSCIRRLRPAETIDASREEIRYSRNLPRIGRGYRRGKPEALAVELRERLDAAVERSIGPATRVGVFVSGGLDSSGVLALAAARCRGASARELTALSLAFAGPGDDRPYLADLARSLGLVPVTLSPRDMGRWIRRSLCIDGRPAWLSSMPIDLALCARVVERSADVVLNGNGGDRICGGMLPFAHLVRRGRPLAALSRALRVRVPWDTTPWGRVREVVSGSLPRFVSRLRRRRPPVDPPWATARSRKLLGGIRESVVERSPPRPGDSPEAWMKDLTRNHMLCDSAELGGQSFAMTGCASVDVFIDLEFVRFMLEIDPMMLSHGHEYRGLYRLAMKGLLPERVRTRQDKACFESALAGAVMAGDSLDFVRDLSSLDALATRDLVNPPAFRSTLDAWLLSLQRGERLAIDPSDEQSQRIWQLLSVEAFLREHGRGRDCV